MDGHWHLTKVGLDGADIMAVDVRGETDTSVHWLYRNDVFRLTSWHEDTIAVPNGHGVELYTKVRLAHDSIVLVNDQGKHEYTLKRVDDDVRHRISDLTNFDPRLVVDVPISDCADALEERSLVHEIFVGRNQISPDQAPYLVKLGDKIIVHPDTEALQLYLEQHKAKLPEARRDAIRPLIYFDTTAPPAILEDITAFYRSRKFVEILLAEIDTSGGVGAVRVCGRSHGIEN